MDGRITFELMAQDTIAFLEQVVGGPAHLVGWSDGATLALYIAARRPDLARRMAVIAGPAHRDGWIPEAIDPDIEPPQFMADAYAELSPDGSEHYPVVVKKLAQMHVEGPLLTAADLNVLPNRSLVMVGDDDEVILEHAIAMYRDLPDAELAVVPGTSHGLLVEKPELCNRLLLDFLCNEPVETFAPIRRRATQSGSGEDALAQ